MNVPKSGCRNLCAGPRGGCAGAAAHCVRDTRPAQLSNPLPSQEQSEPQQLVANRFIKGIGEDYRRVAIQPREYFTLCLLNPYLTHAELQAICQHLYVGFEQDSDVGAGHGMDFDAIGRRLVPEGSWVVESVRAGLKVRELASVH